jgi:hypothetical protein
MRKRIEEILIATQIYWFRIVSFAIYRSQFDITLRFCIAKQPTVQHKR